MLKGLMSSFSKSEEHLKKRKSVPRCFHCLIFALFLKHFSPCSEKAGGSLRPRFCNVVWEARMFYSEEIHVISQILCLAEVHLCVWHY